MAKYKFRALSKNGEIIVKSGIESVDERELIIDQKLKGNEIIYIKQIVEKEGVREFKPRELADFSHELSVMLTSGLTAVRALAVMSSQTAVKNRRMTAVCADLAEMLKKGFSLSEACRKQGGAFPELLINAFSSGEASGNMSVVTRQMANYYERVVRVNQKIKGATTYPKVLLSLTFIIVIIMFTFIMPQFIASGLFNETELPQLTKFMFAISGIFVKNFFFICLSIAALFIATQTFLKTPFFHAAYDKYILKLPMIGQLVKTMCTSRFASTLSYLYNSGIMLTQAVPIAARSTNNAYIINQMTKGVRKMCQGEMLSNVLIGTDGFSQRLAHVTLIGEETGRIGDVMTNMASIFDEETDAAIARLLTLLTPLLLAVMAIVVGGVALSVLLPIISLYKGI